MFCSGAYPESYITQHTLVCQDKHPQNNTTPAPKKLFALQTALYKRRQNWLELTLEECWCEGESTFGDFLQESGVAPPPPHCRPQASMLTSAQSRCLR